MTNGNLNTVNGLSNADLIEAIDSWIDMGESYENAYNLAASVGNANKEHPADELVVAMVPLLQNDTVPQSRGAKGRIANLLAKLKEQQAQELATSAVIFTVAQVAVNELRNRVQE